MPEDDASYLLCAEDAGGAFFFADVAASTCTTADQDDDWCSGAESTAAASFIAELIGGEADYSPRSDYPDRLRSRCIDPADRADSVAWILKVTHTKAHIASP
jgi:cyclin D1/2/4